MRQIPSTDKDLLGLAEQVGGCLRAHGWSLVTAESCTGGWVSKVITDVAGSSVWFERGFVTYTNVAKHEQLGVPDSILREYGAVSEATVQAMAQGALVHSHAQVSLAITGIAGPGGGSPLKPVGTVWFAWGGSAGQGIHTLQHLFQGGRESIRRQAVATALTGLLQHFA